jgi:filamentous hemagglutinin family protein
MNNILKYFIRLGWTISGLAVVYVNPALANIVPDNTLPNNSQVIPVNNNIVNVQGGTQPTGSNNLFHSFNEFSVRDRLTVHFNNAEGIENIITRVTGNSVSKIDGILKTNGAANLFLINPNGIVFGPNASLEIKGSFIASTASSIIFDNNTQFSATNPQAPPLLQVSVPVGLQFGSQVAPIYNESPVNNPISLQVREGKTLALVGGDITLEGVSLRAESGRIELGSVGANSLVRLNAQEGWSLNYQDVQNFQDIRLLSSPLDSNLGSLVDTSGESKNFTNGGSIQLQGRIIEISSSDINNRNYSVKNSGDININAASKLIIQDAGQVYTPTMNQGNAGNINIKSGESVNIIGNNSSKFTGLLAITLGQGASGNITIQTKNLNIQQGGRISVETVIGSADNGGRINIKSNNVVEIDGVITTVNNINRESTITASNRGTGNAGIINIETGKLIVSNGASLSARDNSLTVKKDDSGRLGTLNVNARSIFLENGGTISARTRVNNGGNISLQIQDLLLMKGGSQITTTAGQSGSGGNITINAPNGFIVATPLGNNDITANAAFGSGGKITINAQRIFGLVPRTRAELARLLKDETPNPQDLQTSDITAFSQQDPSLNGIIQINTPDLDPSKGLSELSEETVDPSGQIDRGCGIHGGSPRSNFTFSGRGGLASNPLETLTSEGVLTNWIVLEEGERNSAGSGQKEAEIPQPNAVANNKQKNNFVNNPETIVEAQGWAIDTHGKVVLVAQVPNVESHSPSFNSGVCTVR